MHAIKRYRQIRRAGTLVHRLANPATAEFRETSSEEIERGLRETIDEIQAVLDATRRVVEDTDDGSYELIDSAETADIDGLTLWQARAAEKLEELALYRDGHYGDQDLSVIGYIGSMYNDLAGHISNAFDLNEADPIAYETLEEGVSRRTKEVLRLHNELRDFNRDMSSSEGDLPRVADIKDMAQEFADVAQDLFDAWDQTDHLSDFRDWSGLCDDIVHGWIYLLEEVYPVYTGLMGRIIRKVGEGNHAVLMVMVVDEGTQEPTWVRVDIPWQHYEDFIFDEHDRQGRWVRSDKEVRFTEEHVSITSGR